MGETAGDIRHDIEQTRVRMTATIDAIGYKMDIPARMRYRFSHIIQDVEHAFVGRPGNGDGGEPGLLALGEEKLASMLHAAQGGISEVVGAAEAGLSGATEKVQSGLSDIKENVVDTTTPTRDTTMGDMTTGGMSTTESMKNTAMEATETVKNTALDATETVKNTAVSTWTSVGSFARDNALALGLGAFAVGIVAGMFIPRSRIEEEKIAPLAAEVRHKAVEAGEKAIQKGEEMAKETMDSMGGQPRSGGASTPADSTGAHAGGGQGGQHPSSEPVTAGRAAGQTGSQYGRESVDTSVQRPTPHDTRTE